MAPDENGSNFFASSLLPNQRRLGPVDEGDCPPSSVVRPLSRLLHEGATDGSLGRVAVASFAAPQAGHDALASLVRQTVAATYEGGTLLIAGDRPSFEAGADRREGAFRLNHSHVVLSQNLRDGAWSNMHVKLVCAGYIEGTIETGMWVNLRIICTTENVGDVGGDMPQQHFVIDCARGQGGLPGGGHVDQIPLIRQFFRDAIPILGEEYQTQTDAVQVVDSWAGVRGDYLEMNRGEDDHKVPFFDTFDLVAPPNVKFVYSSPKAGGRGADSFKAALESLNRNDKLQHDNGDLIDILYYSSTIGQLASLHTVFQAIEGAVGDVFSGTTVKLRVVFPTADRLRPRGSGKVFGPSSQDWGEHSTTVHLRDRFVKYVPKYKLEKVPPHAKTMLAFRTPTGGGERKLWFLLSGSHGFSKPAWIMGNYELSVVIAPQTDAARERLLQPVYWEHDNVVPYDEHDKPVTAV